MSRTHVNLERDLHDRARDKAAALGMSLAEYVRRLVAADIASGREAGKPLDIFDLGASAGSDIATQKDRYFAEVSEQVR